MDPYIEQLTAEMADVNIPIGEAWMALAGIHPDDPGYSGVCNLRRFIMVSYSFQVILHGFGHFYQFLLFFRWFTHRSCGHTTVYFWREMTYIESWPGTLSSAKCTLGILQVKH